MKTLSIVLKEYLGNEPTLNEGNTTSLSLNESLNSLETISSESLMVDIEGIHVGPTRNFTWYTEQALRSSVPTWTQPYERPLILHHNEKDGKIIGRVMAATYQSTNTRSKTGALVFSCNVADEDGIKGVKDGRLKTVSIGVIAHDVRCSICGQIISEHGECEHERGMTYDGEVCYWEVYSMEAKELSYVIVPSDIYAHNVKIYSPVNKKQLINNKEGATIVQNLKLSEGAKTDIVESTIATDTDISEVVTNTEKTDESSNVLKETITALEKVIDDLKKELSTEQEKSAQALELKSAAETELVNVGNQLKEFAVEHVMIMREQLGRPALLKESLMSRSNESLLDAIADLKEEATIIASKSIDLSESTVQPIQSEEEPVTASIDITESVQEKLSEIEKPLTESLVDTEKDTSPKKDEKISSIDVKESEQLSNIDYDTAYTEMIKFYSL